MSSTVYWQVAAGAQGRDYSDLFLKHGIAFVGGRANIATMAKVQPTQRIVLKNGMKEFIAVGEIVVRNGAHRGESDKEWVKDVDGWHLPAWCAVDWRKPAQPVSMKGFSMTTIEKISNATIHATVEHLLATLPVLQSQPEPAPTRQVADEEIIEFLINRGLRISAAEELTATIRRIRRLANFYYKDEPRWSEVLEHETRTFLVVPLLLALGWSEQAMKIEQKTSDSKKMDIALYHDAYRGKRDACIGVIETKGFSQGLSYAPEQVKSYAKDLPKCDVVFVTNGFSYKAFKRKNGVFSESIDAHMNLLDPRDNYPIDPSVPGCLELLALLMAK